MPKQFVAIDSGVFLKGVIDLPVHSQKAQLPPVLKEKQNRQHFNGLVLDGVPTRTRSIMLERLEWLVLLVTWIYFKVASFTKTWHQGSHSLVLSQWQTISPLLLPPHQMTESCVSVHKSFLHELGTVKTGLYHGSLWGCKVLYCYWTVKYIII